MSIGLPKLLWLSGWLIAGVLALSGCGGDDGEPAGGAGAPTLSPATTTSASAAQPTATAAAQAAIANDRVVALIVTDAERNNLQPGTFSQVRTNASDVGQAFSANPATGPFLTNLNAVVVQNVWNATATTPSGIYNVQNTIVWLPSAANALTGFNHINDTSPLNNIQRSAGPQGWNGVAQRGEFTVTQGGQTATTYWLFTVGQMK